eukprot:1694630-Alexandrium_andersonii.AAC.1
MRPPSRPPRSCPAPMSSTFVGSALASPSAATGAGPPPTRAAEATTGARRARRGTALERATWLRRGQQ